MIAQVLVTELMKLRRSKVPWFTAGALSMGPLGIALFMWILRQPERAAKLGLLGAKANLSGLEATWPAYSNALVLIVGVGGMLLLAFIVAYVFGREYEDGTAKNMLALPVGRHWFIVGKLVIAFVWWAGLVAVAIAEAFAVGLALGLPGFSWSLAASAAGRALLAAGISYLLVPVNAWAAVRGRGTLAPIGFAMAMMALGNLLGKTGWAGWFPWSIVPLLVGMVSDPLQKLPAGSYVVVVLTSIGGVAAAIRELRRADNAQ